MPSRSAHRLGTAPRPGSPRGFRDRLFTFLGHVSTRRPQIVVLVFAVLAALAYLYIRDFPIRTAYLDLLPQEDPLVKKFQLIQEDTASTDIIAVLLTLDSPSADPAERMATLYAAAERVIEKLQLGETPELVAASYRVGEGRVVPSELVLFRTLSATERDRLREIGHEIQSTLPGLAGGLPSVDASRSLDPGTDPAELLDILAALVEEGKEGLALLDELVAVEPLLAEAGTIARAVLERPAPTEEGEPILSPDGRRLIVQIWPSQRPLESLAFNRVVTRHVRDAVSNADLAGLGVTAGITGVYVTTVEADDMIRRDMGLVTMVSSGVVFLLALLAFASVRLCLAAIVPVLTSALFTMAWAKLAVGGFNLLTVFLPALILGLGIDFSIHILSRYVEERSKGQRVADALVVAVRTKGAACITAAATTAVVFSCLLLSHSRALWDMGAISGVGILISFVTTILLTPALVAVAARERRSTRPRPIASTTALRSVYRRFLRLRPGVVLVGLILTATLVYQASRVQFRFVSDDLAPVTPASALLATVTREFAGDVWLGYSFRFFLDDPADIQPFEARLSAQKVVLSTASGRDLLPQELLGGEGSILDLPVAHARSVVDGLREVLGNWPEEMAEVRTLIARLSQMELAALLTAQVRLAEAASDRGADLVNLLWEMESLDAAERADLLAGMSGDLGAVAELVAKIENLPGEAELLGKILELLPLELRSQYVTKGGKYIVEARLPRTVYEGVQLRTFLDWADEQGVDRFGVPEVTVRLEEYMRRDFLLSTALAVAIIFLLVWRDFPRPLEAALALAPLTMGYVWMLAGMNLLGIQFNFTNIVISPLLIGIGVDGAVHLLHRVDEERAEGGDVVVRGAAASGVPVFVSSMTTMASFGALLAARTPGLRLLGTSALLGLGFTLLWSLTFLPAAVAVLVEKGRRKD